MSLPARVLEQGSGLDLQLVAKRRERVGVDASHERFAHQLVDGLLRDARERGDFVARDAPLGCKLSELPSYRHGVMVTLTIPLANGKRTAYYSGVGRIYATPLDRPARSSTSDLSVRDWTALCEAFDYRCAYCGERPKVLVIEHMVPEMRGGEDTLENIVPACRKCNNEKGQLTPLEWIGCRIGLLRRTGPMHRVMVPDSYEDAPEPIERVAFVKAARGGLLPVLILRETPQKYVYWPLETRKQPAPKFWIHAWSESWTAKENIVDLRDVVPPRRMASDGELAALLEYEDELVCVWCGASVAVGPNALLCEECRAIITGAVTDWHDDDSLPSTVPNRPAA